MAQRLVVIGAGLAAGRALEILQERAPGAFDVTLFGSEPRGSYDRILLSEVLTGEKTLDQLMVHEAAWYARQGIDTRFGESVTAIDRAEKRVSSASGRTPYDKLLIATGSAPVALPLGAPAMDGVLTYRTAEDVAAMRRATERPGVRCVVIGGGLLGLEAAAALTLRGAIVTLLHREAHLLDRQADAKVGGLVRETLEREGIEILCGASARRLVGRDRVEAVELGDGRRIEAELVLQTLGTRPRKQLAAEAGLAVARAIAVDDRMVTSDPDILAIGECAEHRGRCYGLVSPLLEMAAVAAKTLTGEAASFEGAVTSARLRVPGIALFSAGDLSAGDAILFDDPVQGCYKRIALHEDRVVGALLYGNTGDSAWLLKLIRDGSDVAAMRDWLAFGPDYAVANSSDTPDGIADSGIDLEGQGRGSQSDRHARGPAH